jgi:hypothetical protein
MGYLPADLRERVLEEHIRLWNLFQGRGTNEYLFNQYTSSYLRILLEWEAE